MKLRWLVIFLILPLSWIIYVFVPETPQQPNFSRNAEAITLSENAITFTGRIFPRRYNNHPNRAGGHHAIVWKGGRAAPKGLIETDVMDIKILEKLEEIGAVAGNNLPKETWLERNDPHHPAPDRIVRGSAVEILLRWEEKENWLPLETLLEVRGQATFDPRVGGHAGQIPYWKSGCIYCLFSCPGGRTSNAGATIRQQTTGAVQWQASEERLPKDAAPVEIRFRLKKE